MRVYNPYFDLYRENVFGEHQGYRAARYVKLVQPDRWLPRVIEVLPYPQESIENLPCQCLPFEKQPIREFSLFYEGNTEVIDKAEKGMLPIRIQKSVDVEW